MRKKTAPPLRIGPLRIIVGEVVTDPAEIAAVERMRKRLRDKKRKPVGPLGEAAMMGRMTLREVREALAAAKAKKGPRPKAPVTPTVRELESLAQLLEREVEGETPAEKLRTIGEAAPDAAKKVDEAGMKQEGAKKDLEKNMPKDGAEKANEAAKKLDEAAKDVDKQLAEKRGMEANDQQALNPKQADPMAAK